MASTMTHRDLPARRPLGDTPQPLGFLPSMGFWNDWSRQRLVIPLALLALPVAALAQFLAMWLHLSVWLVWPVAIAWPFLLMGLVERHVRKQLAAGPQPDLPAPARPVRSSP